MKSKLRNACQIFQLYEPIYERIGELRLTLKEMYNPDGIIFGLKHSRKKFKRNK